MTDTIFLDASFIIALLDSGDQNHSEAIKLLSQHTSVGRTSLYITNQEMLIEVFDKFGDMPNRELKELMIHKVEQFMSDHHVDVVEQSVSSYNGGMAHYKKYSDKPWGLSDCICFAEMSNRDIYNALSFDQHYHQAGKNVLVVDSSN